MKIKFALLLCRPTIITVATVDLNDESAFVEHFLNFWGKEISSVEEINNLIEELASVEVHLMFYSII